MACNEKWIVELAIVSPITNFVFGANIGLLDSKMAQLFMKHVTYDFPFIMGKSRPTFVHLFTFIWRNCFPIFTIWSYSPPILKLAKPSRFNPSLGKLDSFIAMVLPPLQVATFPSCYCVVLTFKYNNYYSCFVAHKLTSQNNEEEV